MRRIVGQTDERLFIVPETDQAQIRINHAFRGRDRLRIATTAVPRHGHFAVGPEQATIGRHLLHERLADSDVRHRLGLFEPLANRRVHTAVFTRSTNATS